MQYPPTTAKPEVLPNGLTLILDPNVSAPVISMQMWVETGSEHEDAHLGAGLSHFLEHMVFKGTRDYDAVALAEVVQAGGGHWNAYTTFGRTVYYIDGPSESTETFLRCLTGLVFHPLLPESEFEREKDVIRREIDMGMDDPDNVMIQQLLATAFVRDPRRHPVIGQRHLFDALRYEDLCGYHGRRYTPDRCALVVSGDFDLAAVREWALTMTSDAKTGAGHEPLVSADPEQIGPRQARRHFAVPLTKLAMAWKSPAFEHPSAPAFDVLVTLLGHGHSARLPRRLREQAGLAVEIGAFHWSHPGRAGLVIISAEVEPTKRGPLIDAVHAEIAALATEDLTAELAKAQRQIAKSQFGQLLTASGRASDLGSNWHQTRDLDFTRHYLEGIAAVTIDEVRAAAATLRRRTVTLSELEPMELAATAAEVAEIPGLAEIRTHVLANGLEIALIPDRRVPLVRLHAAARGGIISESPANNGLNTLMAATMTRGTMRLDRTEISDFLESLGAGISADCGRNSVSVAASCLSDDLPAVLGVFAEVISQPAYRNETIELERTSQLAALREAAEDPLRGAMQALRHSLFRGTGYGLDALGTETSLAALDRLALAANHTAHFTAANMALAITGDFECDAVLELLEKTHFSDLPEGKRWHAPASEPFIGADLFGRLPKNQAVLAIGFIGCGMESEDRFALAMLQQYLSDMAGPLFTRLREELGLAYRVGAGQFNGYGTGQFTFYIATAPDQLDFARSELLTEISKVAMVGVPETAFERVRATMLSALAIESQSPAHIAQSVVKSLLEGRPADFYRKLPEIVRTLTPQQVTEVAARVFGGEPSISIITATAETATGIQ